MNFSLVLSTVFKRSILVYPKLFNMNNKIICKVVHLFQNDAHMNDYGNDWDACKSNPPSHNQRYLFNYKYSCILVKNNTLLPDVPQLAIPNHINFKSNPSC